MELLRSSSSSKWPDPSIEDRCVMHVATSFDPASVRWKRPLRSGVHSRSSGGNELLDAELAHRSIVNTCAPWLARPASVAPLQSDEYVPGRRFAGTPWHSFLPTLSQSRKSLRPQLRHRRPCQGRLAERRRDVSASVRLAVQSSGVHGTVSGFDLRLRRRWLMSPAERNRVCRSVVSVIRR